MSCDLRQWLDRDAAPSDYYELLGMPRFCRDRNELINRAKAGFELFRSHEQDANDVRRHRAVQLQRKCADAVDVFSHEEEWKRYDERLISRPDPPPPEFARNDSPPSSLPTGVLEPRDPEPHGVPAADPRVVESPQDSGTFALSRDGGEELPRLKRPPLRNIPNPVSPNRPSRTPPSVDRLKRSHRQRDHRTDTIGSAVQKQSRRDRNAGISSDREWPERATIAGFDAFGVRIAMIVAAITAVTVLVGGAVIAFMLGLFSHPRTIGSPHKAAFISREESIRGMPQSLRSVGYSLAHLEISANAKLSETSLG